MGDTTMKANLDKVTTNADCLKAIEDQNEQVYGILTEFLKSFDEQDTQTLLGLYTCFEFENLKN